MSQHFLIREWQSGGDGGGGCKQVTKMKRVEGIPGWKDLRLRGCRGEGTVGPCRASLSSMADSKDGTVYKAPPIHLPRRSYSFWVLRSSGRGRGSAL